MSNSAQGIDVSRMAMEGFGQVMDSMDLVKRAWSGFNLATPFTPTLDVAELDKRIGDLKAVEQWLSLNQNMLRSTIQGLEIQRGTLDAIRTVSESFGQAAKPSADQGLAQTLAHFAAAAAQKSVTPPPAATPAAGAGKAAGAPAGAFDWSPLSMPSAAFASSVFSTGATGGSNAPPQDEAAAEAGSASAPAPDTAAGKPSAGLNPLAWWEMLQENFRHIAQAAAAQSAGPTAGPTADADDGDGASAGGAGGARAARPAQGAAAARSGPGARAPAAADAKAGAKSAKGMGAAKAARSAKAAAPSRTTAQPTGSAATPKRSKPRDAGEQE
jgi:hypothetical protein